MLNCPHCGSKSIGKIGTDQYYCWDCFVEFNDHREIFNVAEDGTLIALEG
ncbi:Uncharacterized [Moorella glycerini]|jgi:ribosomal protein L37AE/L43A|uniref:Uncharacterized protein n=2 Tax=Neomoorella TaxID=44260 RepID=A0A9X7P6V4_9FIRM|nr:MULTISPECIES: hypothetical protein [Moorella]KYH32372.1 hypothetical protein MOMUL_15940 [Moorella mulderi DSM 14980]PRR75310.1 hypothetical protein MOST_08660 [Moorella stamsii]CEP67277.1 Uncharacterized [Moorella glycerini]